MRISDKFYGPETENELNVIQEAELKEIEGEQKQPLTLLERIDRIVNIHSSMLKKHNEGTEKKAKYQKILDRHLTICSDILEINATQMLLFSLILDNLILGNSNLEMKKLARILQVSRIKCLNYLDDLDTLVEKRLIVTRNYDERMSSEGLDRCYGIDSQVVKSLREGKPFRYPRYYNLSRSDFFYSMANLFKEKPETKFSKENFLTDFFNLLKDNIQIEFAENILKQSLSEGNMILLSLLCCMNQIPTAFRIIPYNDLDEFDISRIERFYRYIFTTLEFDLEQLIQKGLIEYSGDDFKDETKIFLTRKTYTELLGFTDAMLQKEQNVLNYETIIPKELFYNEKEEKLVEQLKGLLSENNYRNITEKLKTKKMRTGFNCLFFGAPGTGKTETALQIARISGRDIMLIDISNTKSHWFGESEKIIKGIFVQYRRKAEKARKMNIPVPILFLNEADAIINKRKNTSSNSVVQTENAIQNIILEELEKLDGIVIAATNMIENIDAAFDRDLFTKLNFKSPALM